LSRCAPDAWPCPAAPEHCEGLARDELPCPADDSEACPWLEQRCDQRATTRLLALGVERLAAQPTWTRVPEPSATALRRYVATIGDRLARGQGVGFCGGKGTGKTCAMSLIIRAAWDYSWTIGTEYYELPKLCSRLRDLRDHSRESLCDRLGEVPLLALDDLGREDRAFVGDRIDTIIGERVGNGRTTLLTTNLDPNDMRADPTRDRMMDRLGMACLWVPFAGPSQRRPLTQTTWDESHPKGAMNDGERP